MNGTGINIKLGSGAFTSTMLGGGVALLITGGLIEITSSDVSGKLYFSGWLLIILAWMLYIVKWGYRHWLLTSDTGKRHGLR